VIYGVMVTYNDMPVIESAVRSIASFVDEVIAIDGRYRDFPGDGWYSTDGTLEYLKEAGAYISKVSHLDEVRKRNCYLVGQPGDWYLHLDADEVWHGPFPRPGDFDAAVVTVHPGNLPVHRADPRMERIRFFCHVPGLHYDEKHYWLKDASEQTFALLSRTGRAYRSTRFDEGHIVHNPGNRSSSRVVSKDEYYNILRLRENQIREVL
jgi:hypothetical protein